MQAVLVAGVLLSAAGQMQAGQQAKASYQAAANTAMVQGKSQSLNARKEALEFKKAGTEHRKLRGWWPKRLQRQHWQLDGCQHESGQSEFCYSSR